MGWIGLGSIFGVARYRMTNGLHLHTNLVLTSSLQFQLQEGIIGVALQHLIAGDRLFAISLRSDIDLHLAVFRQIGDDEVGILLRSSLHYGHIGAHGDGTVPVRLQLLFDGRTLGEHH